jgi:hypothetical protein
MSIQTFSAFYYGHNVGTTSTSLDFAEGAGEIQANLTIGDYTLTELLDEVKNQMDAVGGQIYTITVDRKSRLVTISAPGNFELLVDTGSRADSSVYTLLGFTGSDRTGSNTYTGDLPSGSAYEPQFVLQDHISTNDWREFINPSVNESGSGEVEIVRFGEKRFMQCNIKYATNVPQPKIGPIENNPNGLQDLRNFMDFITQKRRLEYMDDRDSPEIFEKFILESTPESSNGTSYKLKEQYGQNAVGYFDTGLLKFRKVI